MASLPLANTFAGGTNGTTISAGNSGGASGDAIDTLDNSGNTTWPQFSSTHSIHSSTLCLADTDIPSGNASAGWGGFNGGSGYNLTDIWMRCYMWLTANPTGGNYQFAICNSIAGSANSLLRINGTGKLSMTIKASGTGGFISTNSIPTGQWVRYEQRVKADTVNGEVQCRYWTSADSTGSPDEDSGSLTGKVLQANVGQWLFGMQGAPPTAPFSGYIADIAVSADGWIGPTGGTPTITSYNRIRALSWLS